MHMSGYFGVVSKEDCVFDLFFGTDYHSHLGTRRAGLAVYGKDGFNRSIHNIENSPFRTKFDDDVHHMKGNLGIGCISDFEAQPLIVRSHHGTFAITTVSKINNMDELVAGIMKKTGTHFLEMSGGSINATELVATLINQKDNLIEGIQYAQQCVEGSLSLMIMTPQGIYVARDKVGRTPMILGKKAEGFCATFESTAYLNLGYEDYKELGPGEIDIKARLEARAERAQVIFVAEFFEQAVAHHGIGPEHILVFCSKRTHARKHHEEHRDGKPEYPEASRHTHKPYLNSKLSSGTTVNGFRASSLFTGPTTEIVIFSLE